MTYMRQARASTARPIHSRRPARGASGASREDQATVTRHPGRPRARPRACRAARACPARDRRLVQAVEVDPMLAHGQVGPTGGRLELDARERHGDPAAADVHLVGVDDPLVRDDVAVGGIERHQASRRAARVAGARRRRRGSRGRVVAPDRSGPTNQRALAAWPANAPKTRAGGWASSRSMVKVAWAVDRSVTVGLLRCRGERDGCAGRHADIRRGKGGVRRYGSVWPSFCSSSCNSRR